MPDGSLGCFPNHVLKSNPICWESYQLLSFFFGKRLIWYQTYYVFLLIFHFCGQKFDQIYLFSKESIKPHTLKDIQGGEYIDWDRDSVMAASGTAATFRASVSSAPSSSSSFQLTHLRSPFKALKFTPLPSSRSRSSFSVSCTIAKEPAVLMAAGSDPTLWQRPDSFGRFGKFGGKYVPETLMHALSELESAFHALATDDDFQVCPLNFLDLVLRDCRNLKHFALWVVGIRALSFAEWEKVWILSMRNVYSVILDEIGLILRKIYLKTMGNWNENAIRNHALMF